MLAKHGIDVDPELTERIAKSLDPLSTANLDAALLIQPTVSPPRRPRRYVERWRLATPEQGAHAVRFATDPTWRAYVVTYTAGRDLCRAYIGRRPGAVPDAPDRARPRRRPARLVSERGCCYRARVRAADRRRDGRACVRRAARAARAGDGRAARTRRHGGRRRRRPGGPGRAGSGRGRLGQDARHRALAPAACARGRDRREPGGARRARGPKRRQGDLVGQGRARRRDAAVPLLRLGDRLDRRPIESDRRLTPLLLAEGARRRRRADRSLELPAADGDLEARARARGRAAPSCSSPTR